MGSSPTPRRRAPVCAPAFLLVVVLITAHGTHGRLLQQQLAGQQQQQQPRLPVQELPDLTTRPIICVLTQPGDLAKPGESYLAAGYVKWIEAAGARVVPVLFDMGEAEIAELFSMCNGVLFPGGNYPLRTDTKWFEAGEQLYQLAVDANKAGEFVPVLGECLGLQLLATIITRDQYVLVPLEAANRPHALQWTAEVPHSQLLTQVPGWVQDSLSSLPLAMHNHHFGLVDESFERYPELGQAFRVLAHTQDWQNTTYVSVLEHKEYPFVGFAFHNEKVPYEWTLDIDIPHTRAATDAAYMLGQAFVSLARKNAHRGEDVVAEDQRLIYNWTPRFAGKHSSAREADLPFEQVYIFKRRRDEHNQPDAEDDVDLEAVA